MRSKRPGSARSCEGWAASSPRVARTAQQARGSASLCCRRRRRLPSLPIQRLHVEAKIAQRLASSFVQEELDSGAASSPVVARLAQQTRSPDSPWCRGRRWPQIFLQTATGVDLRMAKEAKEVSFISMEVVSLQSSEVLMVLSRARGSVEVEFLAAVTSVELRKEVLPTSVDLTVAVKATHASVFSVEVVSLQINKVRMVLSMAMGKVEVEFLQATSVDLRVVVFLPTTSVDFRAVKAKKDSVVSVEVSRQINEVLMVPSLAMGSMGVEFLQTATSVDLRMAMEVEGSVINVEVVGLQSSEAFKVSFMEEETGGRQSTSVLSWPWSARSGTASKTRVARSRCPNWAACWASSSTS